MYVFAAIPVPRSLQEKIAPLQQAQEFAKLLRPSRLELHITLKAPQEIQDSQKDEWVQVAKLACSGFSSVELKITGLNFLTTTVLALYIDPKPLMGLHGALARALQPYNGPADRLHEGTRYQPHITIGRALRGPLDVRQRRLVIEKLTPLAPKQRFSINIVRLYGREENAFRPLRDRLIQLKRNRH